MVPKICFLLSSHTICLLAFYPNVQHLIFEPQDHSPSIKTFQLASYKYLTLSIQEETENPRDYNLFPLSKPLREFSFHYNRPDALAFALFLFLSFHHFPPPKSLSSLHKISSTHLIHYTQSFFTTIPLTFITTSCNPLRLQGFEG